jgi:hypothetical protein
MSRKRKHRWQYPSSHELHEPVSGPVPHTQSIPGRKFIPQVVPFWSFNWREILVDLGMIIFSITFSKFAIRNGNIVDSVSPITLLLIFSGVVFFMPMFLAYIHAFYKAYYGEDVGKVVKWLFMAIVFVMLIFLLVVIFHVGGENGIADREPVKEHFMMFGMFMLVLGPMTSLGGMTMGEDAVKNGKSTDGVMMTSSFIGLTLGIAFMIWMFFTKDPQQVNGIFGFLYIMGGLLAAALVCVIVIGIGMGIQKLIEKMGMQKEAQILFSTLLPFLIVILLIFWNEVGIGMMRHGLQIDPHHPQNSGAIIPLLFITGYIPFRVVLLFAPPVRGINLVVGIAGIIYFLLSSIGLL